MSAPAAPVDLSDLDAGLVFAYVSHRLPWSTRSQTRNVAERWQAMRILVEAHGLEEAGARLGTTERTACRWWVRKAYGEVPEVDALLLESLRAAEHAREASPLPSGRIVGGEHGGGLSGLSHMTRSSRAAGNRQLGNRSAA